MSSLILPAEMLEKLHDLQARGMSINSDPAFFHLRACGMAVRNLCRERVNDNELAAQTACYAIWERDAALGFSPRSLRCASKGGGVFDYWTSAAQVVCPLNYHFSRRSGTSDGPSISGGASRRTCSSITFQSGVSDDH